MSPLEEEAVESLSLFRTYSFTIQAGAGAAGVSCDLAGAPSKIDFANIPVFAQLNTLDATATRVLATLSATGSSVTLTTNANATAAIRVSVMVDFRIRG